MQQLTKFIITFCLIALCQTTAHGKIEKGCEEKIKHSIVHLEVLKTAHDHGEIDTETLVSLVEDIDTQVEGQLKNCHANQSKFLGVASRIFGENSSIYDYIRNLYSSYRKTRDELLNGTERVD